ncbi:MAG: U32 family peptidase [Bacteroidales bacterium]|nr:U32 family peptidase [Candidatus Cacconaster equi]
MQLALELLAPARNMEIGTAAIDCGADAVYIAGPSFGARAAAGNPVGDIARLCDYAHTYGVRIYATLNTLLEPQEYKDAERLVRQYHDAGVDALIVQDMNLLNLDLPPMELHASTQSVIRTPERAAALEKAGFSRLILERQLSLEQIKAIRDAVNCDLEFFVHGALCVCYSGQCYLSEELTGRSANRGCCAQPCRSRYDLVDAEGRIIVRDQPLLSLKDYRLDGRIDDLVKCGVSSFKIEGRLKNASYVKNVVRHYRNVIDNFIARNPQYSKSSYGQIAGGFEPKPDATFNRGYTSAWIDGKRCGKWNSSDSAKSMGEYVGEISSVNKEGITIRLPEDVRLANGDGLSFVKGGEEVCGMRAEVVHGNQAVLKETSGLSIGMKVFRSLNLRFERELEKNMPKRLIKVGISYTTFNGETCLTATDEAGITVKLDVEEAHQKAQKCERAVETLHSQLNKVTEPFVFSLEKVEADEIYFYTASEINGWRRRLRDMLLLESRRPALNISDISAKAGAGNVKPGKDELMRMKYCLKWELGLCPKQKGKSVDEPLYLVNRNRKFCLHFDCKNCEMTVSL